VSDEATYVAAVLRVLKQCSLLSPLGSHGGLITSSTASEELDEYGSSYFDKHWKQRHQLERFMLRFGRNSNASVEGKVEQVEQEEEEGDAEGDEEGEGDEEQAAEVDQEGEEGDEGDEGEEQEEMAPAEEETVLEGDEGDEGDE